MALSAAIAVSGGAVGGRTPHGARRRADPHAGGRGRGARHGRDRSGGRGRDAVWHCHVPAARGHDRDDRPVRGDRRLPRCWRTGTVDSPGGRRGAAQRRGGHCHHGCAACHADRARRRGQYRGRLARTGPGIRRRRDVRIDSWAHRRVPAAGPARDRPGRSRMDAGAALPAVPGGRRRAWCVGRGVGGVRGVGDRGAGAHAPDAAQLVAPAIDLGADCRAGGRRGLPAGRGARAGAAARRGVETRSGSR